MPLPGKCRLIYPTMTLNGTRLMQKDQFPMFFFPFFSVFFSVHWEEALRAWKPGCGSSCALRTYLNSFLDVARIRLCVPVVYRRGWCWVACPQLRNPWCAPRQAFGVPCASATGFPALQRLQVSLFSLGTFTLIAVDPETCIKINSLRHPTLPHFARFTLDHSLLQSTQFSHPDRTPLRY